MSTYWGYYCRNCDEASDHWHNHGDELLVEFYDAWHVVKAMNPVWIHVGTTSSWADLEMSVFLEDHMGHDVALQSEYGDVRDIHVIDKKT
jgi:hypothetical protein